MSALACAIARSLPYTRASKLPSVVAIGTGIVSVKIDVVDADGEHFGVLDAVAVGLSLFAALGALRLEKRFMMEVVGDEGRPISWFALHCAWRIGDRWYVESEPYTDGWGVLMFSLGQYSEIDMVPVDSGLF